MKNLISTIIIACTLLVSCDYGNFDDVQPINDSTMINPHKQTRRRFQFENFTPYNYGTVQWKHAVLALDHTRMSYYSGTETVHNDDVIWYVASGYPSYKAFNASIAWDSPEVYSYQDLLNKLLSSSTSDWNAFLTYCKTTLSITGPNAYRIAAAFSPYSAWWFYQVHNVANVNYQAGQTSVAVTTLGSGPNVALEVNNENSIQLVMNPQRFTFTKALYGAPVAINWNPLMVQQMYWYIQFLKKLAVRLGQDATYGASFLADPRVAWAMQQPDGIELLNDLPTFPYWRVRVSTQFPFFSSTRANGNYVYELNLNKITDLNVYQYPGVKAPTYRHGALIIPEGRRSVYAYSSLNPAVAYPSHVKLAAGINFDFDGSFVIPKYAETASPSILVQKPVIISSHSDANFPRPSQLAVPADYFASVSIGRIMDKEWTAAPYPMISLWDRLEILFLDRDITKPSRLIFGGSTYDPYTQRFLCNDLVPGPITLVDASLNSQIKVGNVLGPFSKQLPYQSTTAAINVHADMVVSAPDQTQNANEFAISPILFGNLG